MKKIHDSETLILGRVIADLSKLPSERLPAVLSYISERLLGSGSSSVTVATQTGPSSIQQTTTNPGTGGVHKGEKIGTFILRKSPQNNYQKVAVLAYYLEEVENLEDHDTGEITAASKRARLATTNWAQVITDAQTKYKYFTRTSGRKRRLTNVGQQVVEALPDTSQLEEVMRKSSGERSSKKMHRRKKATV